MSETKRCKNCNSQLMGDYCFNCGQAVRNMDLSIFYFIKEYFGNLLSLDSKVLVTFKYLLTRPGFLSSEYISGKRKRYTLPSRLYVFVAITSIILFSLLIEDKTHYLKFYNEGLGIVIAEDIDGEHAKYTIAIVGSSQDWDDIDGEPLHFDIFSYLSKIFLLLFPLFALLLKFFYWKKLYIYHLILVLHNHSFMLISFSLIFLINKLFNLFGFNIMSGFFIFILFVLFGSYFYISAYKFYNVGKIITLMKFFPLAISYLVVLAISSVAIAKLFFIFPNIFR